jgi:glycogen operon protein
MRLCGSSDLYEQSGRRPYASINFVTCHDGFTLTDLVSYGQKHNEANGEENRDGSNNNDNWNCGAEGPSADPAINALRARQKRNLIATLLFSQGVPMLLGGDELSQTQKGNNNAYCQDNEVSWLDWSLEDDKPPVVAATTSSPVPAAGEGPGAKAPSSDGKKESAPVTPAASTNQSVPLTPSPAPVEGRGEQGEKARFFEFVKKVIRLRSEQPVFQRRKFFQGRAMRGEGVTDLSWFGPKGKEMNDGDWGGFVRCLGMRLAGDLIGELDTRGDPITGDTFLVLMNAHHEPIPFAMPATKPEHCWELILDTADDAAEPRLIGGGTEYDLRDRSVAVFRTRQAEAPPAEAAPAAVARPEAATVTPPLLVSTR